MLGMDALWHQRAVWWQTPPRANTAGFGWEPHWHSPQPKHGPKHSTDKPLLFPSGICFPRFQAQAAQDTANTSASPAPASTLPLSSHPGTIHKQLSLVFFHPESNFTQLGEAKQGPQLPLRNNHTSFKPALTHQLLQSQNSSQQSEVALVPDTSQGCSRTDTARSAAPQQELPEEQPPPSPGHGLRPPDANRAPVRSGPCLPPAPLRSSPPRAAAASWCPAAPPFKSPAPRNGRCRPRHGGPAPRRLSEAAGTARRLLPARYPAALTKSRK